MIGRSLRLNARRAVRGPPAAEAGFADLSDLGRQTPRPAAATRAIRASPRLSALAAVVGLAAVYVLLGLTGHDPWKQDEAYLFGATFDLLQDGDWVVPKVAGEPFVEKPPLYYWTAAVFAWLAYPWLPLHDGARLASGLFTATSLLGLGLAARETWGTRQAAAAIVVMLGCAGLLVHSHMMLTDLAVMAGFALALYGWALCPRRPLVAGLLLGTGAGLGFMGKGLLAPGVLGSAALLLPLAFANWRNGAYARALLAALVASAPWLIVWPVALYGRSPELFVEWFWLNNIGRLAGFSVPQLGADHEPWFWWHTLPWFCFPAWPLALATLWRRRGVALRDSTVQSALVVAAVTLAVLGVSASARGNYALPLLVPVCLLAAPAATRLSGTLDRRLGWLVSACFGLLAALYWAVWLRMVATGAPPHWAWLTRYLPADFVAPVQPGPLAVAILLTLLAVTARWWGPESRFDSLSRWAIGTTLCWGLAMTLWLPWIDAAKSYRGVFEAMRQAMPSAYRCVLNDGLGESERAMLEYVTGLVTRRPGADSGLECDLLLFKGTVQDPPILLASGGWTLLWQGARQGDSRERFWLLRRG